MASGLLLLLLSTYCTGALAQFTLTQPPSISASPRETVQIPCVRSSGTIANYYVSWYQQKDGGAPKMMIYDFNKRPTGIPDRFSGSTDASDNSAILTISSLQAEDEADYYCLSYDDSTKRVFGGGTQLIVTDANQPSLPPNVNLFPPSVEEKESKNKATLVCLVDGFRPPDITVTWLADGTAISTGVETTKATKLNDNYVASSYLTLNPSEWESHASYSCKVTHKGIDYTKSVGHSGSQCS